MRCEGVVKKIAFSFRVKVSNMDSGAEDKRLFREIYKNADRKQELLGILECSKGCSISSLSVSVIGESICLCIQVYNESDCSLTLALLFERCAQQCFLMPLEQGLFLYLPTKWSDKFTFIPQCLKKSSLI